MYVRELNRKSYILSFEYKTKWRNEIKMVARNLHIP